MAESHTLSLMLGTEKSLSWCGGSWYRTLELGTSFLSGILAFGRSEPLTLLPTWTEVLVGPGCAVPTRGLDPTENESPPLGGRVPHRDACLPEFQIWGSTIQCSMTPGFLNHYMRTKTSIPQTLKRKAAARKWQFMGFNPRVLILKRIEICLHEWLKKQITK